MIEQVHIKGDFISGRQWSRESKMIRNLFIFGWQDETDLQIYKAQSLYWLKGRGICLPDLLLALPCNEKRRYNLLCITYTIRSRDGIEAFVLPGQVTEKNNNERECQATSPRWMLPKPGIKPGSAASKENILTLRFQRSFNEVKVMYLKYTMFEWALAWMH